jgi:hypothetical protein
MVGHSQDIDLVELDEYLAWSDPVLVGSNYPWIVHDHRDRLHLARTRVDEARARRR